MHGHAKLSLASSPPQESRPFMGTSEAGSFFSAREPTGEPVIPKPQAVFSNQHDEELVRYINLKLPALGQPTSRSAADRYFLEIAGPLLRNYYQKDQLLADRLCPADARIQSFLDAYLSEVCPEGAQRLPANPFVLGRPGLGREMSLPPGEDLFTSPYLQSYRVPQG